MKSKHLKWSILSSVNEWYLLVFLIVCACNLTDCSFIQSEKHIVINTGNEKIPFLQGMAQEAIEIEDADQRAIALSYVAGATAQKGEDTTQANKWFKLAIHSALQQEFSVLNADALDSIIQTTILLPNYALPVLEQMAQEIISIRDPYENYYHATLLSHIALAAAEIGEKDQASIWLDLSLKSAMKINESSSQSSTYSLIAERAIKITPQTASIFQALIEKAQQIEDVYYRALTLKNISVSVAQRDINLARVLIDLSVESALRIDEIYPNSHLQAEILSANARIAAKMGDIPKAQSLFDLAVKYALQIKSTNSSGIKTAFSTICQDLEQGKEWVIPIFQQLINNLYRVKEPYQIAAIRAITKSAAKLGKDALSLFPLLLKNTSSITSLELRVAGIKEVAWLVSEVGEPATSVLYQLINEVDKVESYYHKASICSALAKSAAQNGDTAIAYSWLKFALRNAYRIDKYPDLSYMGNILSSISEGAKKIGGHKSRALLQEAADFSFSINISAMDKVYCIMPIAESAAYLEDTVNAHLWMKQAALNIKDIKNPMYRAFALARIIEGVVQIDRPMKASLEELIQMTLELESPSGGLPPCIEPFVEVIPKVFEPSTAETYLRLLKEKAVQLPPWGDSIFAQDMDCGNCRAYALQAIAGLAAKLNNWQQVYEIVDIMPNDEHKTQVIKTIMKVWVISQFVWD